MELVTSKACGTGKFHFDLSGSGVMPIYAWPGGFSLSDLLEPTVIWFKGSFVCRLSKRWAVKTGLVQTYLLSWANFYRVTQNSWASQLHKQGFINGPKLYLTESKSLHLTSNTREVKVSYPRCKGCQIWRLCKIRHLKFFFFLNGFGDDSGQKMPRLVNQRDWSYQPITIYHHWWWCQSL